MISPAAPSTTLSLAAVTGSGPGASEKSPIPEGFAALLAIDGGGAETASESQAPADAGLATILEHAASGKAGGKMLPLLLPANLTDSKFGRDDTSAMAPVAMPASSEPDASNSEASGQAAGAEAVPFVLPDLIAIPAPSIVVSVQPAGTSAPASSSEATSSFLLSPSRYPIEERARTALTAETFAAAAPMLPTPAVARSAGASEPVAMPSMPTAAPQAPASGSASTPDQTAMATPGSSIPMMAASVQVAARIAISAKGSDTGVPASSHRPADPVIADEPQPAASAPSAAPVAQQANAPADPVNRGAEALPEQPRSIAAAVRSERAVGEANITVAPAQIPLVMTAETPASSLQLASNIVAAAGHERAPAPHDFAGLVERLVEARDAVAPLAVRTALHHAEFGRVALAFSTDQGGLAVQMASPDPAFAPAVAAAAQVSTGTDAGAGQNSGQPRQDTQAQGGSSHQQAQTQSQAQDGERQTRNGPTLRADGEHETATRRGDEPRPRADSGIYA